MITLAEYYSRNQFNPTTFDILSEEKLQIHRQKRDNLYLNKLSIPNLVWRGVRVLEVGCSSGENSLLYAQMGAKLTFIEPLANSIEKLKSLFRHYNIEQAVEKIHLDTIENVPLEENYDIIVAEGFLNALEQRSRIIRSLYQALAEDGLLIISTIDRVGAFLEYTKAALAQLFCRKETIEEQDRQVEAIKPFFEDDFERIPHSRDFSLWAKDVLLSPIMTTEPFYDFDEMVKDLSELQPKYYSSWPAYRPVNDLTWHKYIPNEQKELQKIVRGYYFKRPSFLFGRVQEETHALRYLLENQDGRLISHLKSIMAATRKELHESQSGSSLLAVEDALKVCRGEVHSLMVEIYENLRQLHPDTYRHSPLLRQHWGVPCHYIVFRK